MPSHSYQMGPLIVNSEVTLPYPETNAPHSHASIELTDELPDPPTLDHSRDDVLWVGKTAWLFIENVLQGISLPNRHIVLLRSEATKQYSAIMMLALRSLLIQFGMVLLYGAAIASEGEASVFVGKSGSGKSTTAAREAILSGRFLNDDMVPLYTDEYGTVCTFQCDRYTAISSTPPAELTSLYRALPPSLATRVDQKSVYKIGDDDGGIYPITKIIFLGDAGSPIQRDLRSPESLQILIQGLIGPESINKVMGISRMSALTRLVHQIVGR